MRRNQTGDCGSSRIDCHREVAELLERHGLSEAAALIATESGEALRRLERRENWRLELAERGGRTVVFYLKKHWQRSLADRLRVSMGRPPRTPAWHEAERCRQLTARGIATMSVCAVAEQWRCDGSVASALLTRELAGYRQLDLFLTERFSSADDPALTALAEACGRLAGRFHRAGFNHRDFYSCHFFVRADRERSHRFQVSLIDLQRLQRWPALLRRRWVVKDLGQLAYSTPTGLVRRTTGLRFFKEYLQQERLSRGDKRLARAALRRAAALRRKHGPYRCEWETDVGGRMSGMDDRGWGFGKRAA